MCKQKEYGYIQDQITYPDDQVLRGGGAISLLLPERPIRSTRNG